MSYELEISSGPAFPEDWLEGWHTAENLIVCGGERWRGRR
jgi:hypothetical protein